jgi:hypothetical protein
MAVLVAVLYDRPHTCICLEPADCGIRAGSRWKALAHGSSSGMKILSTEIRRLTDEYAV